MFIIGFMDFAQVMSSQNNWVYMNDVCLQKKIYIWREGKQ